MRFQALALALSCASCGGQDNQTKDAMPLVTAATASLSSAAPSGGATALATASATAAAATSSAPVALASASAVPSGSADATAPETLLGTVKIKSIQAAWAANSDKVGDRMILGFRRCYSKAIEADPTTGPGDVRIQANIGANGEVISAKVLKPSKLPAAVESCMATRVSTALFAPPPAAPGFLKVTIHCEPR